MIFYMYNLHIGSVPSLGFLSTSNQRTKTKYIPKINYHSAAKIKSIRMSSFFTKGPQLFNLLPEELREAVTDVTPDKFDELKAAFKTSVDKWLELVPDEPTTEGLQRAADSNSIVDQVKIHGREIARKWKTICKSNKQRKS